MSRFWVCSTCGSKRKGPDRPRRDASVRYCFPCSDKKGTLVERHCPTLDRQREIRRKRKEARREKEKIRSGRFTVEGEDLLDRLHALVRLTCWSEVFLLHGEPELSVRWSKAYPDGVSGSAHEDSWKVCMTIGVSASYAEAEETLIHELAHLAVGCEHFHDKSWRMMFQQAVFEAWGVLAQGRKSSDLDVNAMHGIESIRQLRMAA